MWKREVAGKYGTRDRGRGGEAAVTRNTHAAGKWKREPAEHEGGRRIKEEGEPQRRPKGRAGVGE